MDWQVAIYRHSQSFNWHHIRPTHNICPIGPGGISHAHTHTHQHQQLFACPRLFALILLYSITHCSWSQESSKQNKIVRPLLCNRLLKYQWTTHHHTTLAKSQSILRRRRRRRVCPKSFPYHSFNFFCSSSSV